MQAAAQTDSFGKMIRKARLARGWTLAELGDRIGKPLSAVADMEREKTIPADKTLMGKLAYHLRIDIQDLMVAASAKAYRGDGISEEDFGEALVQGIFAPQHSAQSDISEVGALGIRDIEASASLFLDNCIDLPPGLGYMDENGFVDIMSFYDTLSKRALPIIDGCNIRVKADYFGIDEHESYVEGKTKYDPDLELITVYLREDVWDAAALRKNHRARFSAAHELGHAVLHWQSLVDKEGAALFRDSTITPSQSLRQGQMIYRNPEWQANSWASALLMPMAHLERLISDLSEYDDPETKISERFGVSLSAARYRLQKLYVHMNKKGQMDLDLR